MSAKAFAKECEDRIKLTLPRPEEEEANKEILLKRPKTQAEERGEHSDAIVVDETEL